jgi:excinuclease ABC subunit A
VDRPYCRICDLDLAALTPKLLNPRSREGACPACQGVGCGECAGTRLHPTARAVRWRGRTLPEVLADPLAATADWMAAGDPDPVAGPLLADAARRLGLLVDLGLGALALDRPAAALATGELARLRLARAAGSALSGVVYTLDEPTAGLGDAETAAVIRLLRGLVDAGNTVIATEHHPAVIAAADQILELGPGAGPSGGRLVFDGAPEDLASAETPTGRWLSGRDRLPPPRRRTLTLRDWGGEIVSTGGLVAFVGPSGAGKSRLFTSFEARPGSPFDRIVRADQLGLRGTSRSMPATVLGLWDLVRELLASTREARVRGFDAGMFSLAVKGGRCEACGGTGRQSVDLGVLPEVELPCVVCEGRRFAADVRTITWKGHSADQLLALGAEAAGPILGGHPKIDPILRVLRDVGLGYVPLGMPVSDLSGGESHRLALARELLRGAGRPGSTLYLLDGPTIGLHPADVATLLGALHGLADAGGTVWIATHDRALASACDEIVELPR